MNVEIGAEAARFPEKEYIPTQLPLQCVLSLRPRITVLNSIFIQICIYFVLGNEKVMCYFLQTTSKR